MLHKEDESAVVGLVDTRLMVEARAASWLTIEFVSLSFFSFLTYSSTVSLAAESSAES